MSIQIYISHVDLHRHVPRLSPALAQRLEALTGEEASCCVADFKSEIAQMRLKPGFADALKRAKALGDEKRFLALALLKRRESMCACEVQAALGLTHATVSHHMGVLLDAGLVASEKRGKWVHYTLTPEGRSAIAGGA